MNEAGMGGGGRRANMQEALKRGGGRRVELEEALTATTRQMQRLLRELRDADLAEKASAEVKRTRRQLRSNRELLGASSREGAGDRASRRQDGEE